MASQAVRSPLLTLSLAVLLAAPVERSTERLHVDWVAPEGCPTRAELASSLEADVPANHTFHASVRIDEPNRDAGPWRAVVLTTADGVEHTRVVEAADCERVSSAAVLVVTLAATNLPALDAPAAGAHTSGHQNEADAPAEPAPPPALSGGDRAAHDNFSPFSFHIRVQPLVGANIGLFPQPGLSWGLGVAFMTGRVRAQAAVASWSGSSSGPTRGVQLGLTSFAVRGAWLFAPADFLQLGPSAGLEMGSLSATGFGISSPQSSGLFWGCVVGGPTAGFSLTKRISAWVTTELGVNLTRPQYSISEGGHDVTVYGVGWLVGRITLGVELDLPFP
jgi:hypothetical protein